MTPKLKLTYFDFPGRAETARLLFKVGNVPFEDAFVTQETWPELKPKTPFGQVPILEVDGTTIAQSGAIHRYAAHLAGLYPSDPLEAAKTEMAAAQMADCVEPIYQTMALKENEDKVKVRQELLAGKVGERLKALDAVLAASGGPFVLGSKMTWIDLDMFNTLSTLQSGRIDGVPKDLTHLYPALKKLRNAVASVPAVAERYRDDPSKHHYKPDA